MRFRGLFVLAAAFLVLASAVQADYIFVRIDLGLIYKEQPTMSPLAPVAPPPMMVPQVNPQPGGKGKVGMPQPRPMPLPMPPHQPGVLVPKVPPGEGPFVYALIELKGPWKYDEKPGVAASMLLMVAPTARS